VRRALLFILVLGAIAAGADFFSPYRGEPLQLLLVDASGREHALRYDTEGWLALGGDESKLLRIRTRTAGTQSGGRVEFNLEGGVLFVSRAARELPDLIGAKYGKCASADSSSTQCRYAFQLIDSETIDFGTATGAPRLSAVKLTVLKTSVTARIDLSSLAYLYGGLAIVGALFLLLPLSASAKSWTLIIIGAGWILVAGVGSGVVALTIVLAVGAALWQVMKSKAVARQVIALAAAISGLFLVANVLSNASAGIFANPGSLPLPVPLGLAFFSIRALELTFRVGTRELRDMSARDYLLFMLFPATLAAGPIFSYGDFKKGAISQPSVVDWSAGLARIGVGAIKKVICEMALARVLAPKLLALYVDPEADRLALWLLLVPYAIYVYLDFSAYSDIAIGTGRMLGWRVPENFNWPFMRSNLRAFWTSWHMTLSLWVSRWVHFFVAFPLRRAPRAAQVALPVIASLLVMGLWHELQITWLMWGLHHATGILLSDVLAAMAAALVLPALLGKLLDGAKRAIGMSGVLLWVSLSHCFTLVSDPALALALWGHALGLR
jgi:alginate O-acetyltransferase complex protein AlgI